MKKKYLLYPILTLCVVLFVATLNREDRFSNIQTNSTPQLTLNGSKAVFAKASLSNPLLSKQQPKTPTPDDLKQTDWYADAVKDLENREYHFTKVATSHGYTTPNRKNNLRFHYTGDGFSVAPRITKIPQGNYNESTPEKDKKYTEIANWNIAFNVDKRQIGDGTWKIENNKAEYVAKDVTVQYINDEKGMRQNFIVQNPLPTQDSLTNKLSLNFSVKTELDCKLSDKALQFYHNTDNVMNYQDLKVWDANMQPLEAHLVAQNNADSTETKQYAIVVNTIDAVYPITIDPISTTPNTTLTYNGSNAKLGWSVASAGDVNGDGYSDVIVGVPGYSNIQNGEGAAFIYHGSSTGIGSTANTILEINAYSAAFGWCVSTAGDLNGDGYSDVIASTKDLDFGQTDEGGVYVYYGSANGINTATSHFLEANQAYAYFGWSVACAGDVNGDGYSDVLVGAPYYDKNGATDGGVVYVYHGSASGIITTPVDTLYRQNQFYITFGKSVASAGDLNADGFSDIVIGAPLFTDNLDNTPQEGAAFVYYGSASGMVNLPTILQCDQADARMGNAVASAGDVNGDGYGDLIIGAEFYDAVQVNEGAAFIYHGSATGVNNGAAIVLYISPFVARFGASVASAGDINGDGYGDVIVGQPDLNSYNGVFINAIQVGKAYVYQGSASGLSNNNTALYIGNAQAKFGASVASAGDVNGDGYSDIIVGQQSPLSTSNAYIYLGAPQGIDAIADASRESNQPDAQMGISVSNAGDVNGDGFSDVIVGAPNYDNGQYKEGTAFVYLGSANGLAAFAALLEYNVANAFFGSSVSAAGDVNGDGYGDIIVGAYGYSNGETNEGAFFIYHGSASGINTSPAFIRESNQTNAFFGASVSSAGDVNGDGYSDVIVGSELYDNGQTDEGAAFVYYGSAAGITLAGGTLLEFNQANARFGESVSIAGDVNGDGYSDIVVGAYLYDDGQNDEGAAFVYHGSSAGISTNAAVVLQINQDYAQFGNAVSDAGDVNGDGYSDIVVGAYLYNNNQDDEGAAFVYHGSAAGISTNAAVLLQTNQDYAQLGESVSCAGDVNGDGYSDIIVGAYLFDSGETDEGAAFVYYGSPTGINPTIQAHLQCNQVNARFGTAVSGAGDFNGDGFSDVIVGARFYDNGQTDEGAAFIYNGNEANGKKNNLRLYNSDLSTPINNTNFDKLDFGAGLFAKSPQGRRKGRLVWEAKPDGQPFSNNPITNSILFTSKQTAYTDLGLGGIELKNLVVKQGFQTKIRVRVEYDKTTSLTGQVYGPWRYLESYSKEKVIGNKVSISGTTTVCINTSSPNITFTNYMTSVATITYNINGGANQTINVPARGTNTVAAPTGTVGTFTYNITQVVYNSSPASGTYMVSGVSAVVTVINGLLAGTITGTSAICPNGTSQLNISGNSATGTWQSANPAIATVSNTGLVTGVSAGNVNINYIVTGTGGCVNVTATFAVVVTAPPVAGTITGTSAICANSGSQLIISGNSANGSWQSTNPAIAVVSNTGYVNGVSAGNVNINYIVSGTGGCANSSTATFAMVLTAPAVAGPITGTSTICSNSTTQLNLPANATSPGVWYSLNPAIATVSNTGLVNGVSAGNVVIGRNAFGYSGCATASAFFPMVVIDNCKILNMRTSIPYNDGLVTAVSDAIEGDTLLMLDHIAQTGDINFTKSLTINANGFTLTFVNGNFVIFVNKVLKILN
jgi:hypothetical protein